MQRYLALLLILFSVPAFAQDEPDRTVLHRAAVVWGAAVAADWYTTDLNQRHAFAEANPLYTWTGGSMNEKAVMLTSVVEDTAIAVTWYKVVGAHHPKLAAAGFYISAAVRAGFAGSNYYHYLHRRPGT